MRIAEGRGDQDSQLTSTSFDGVLTTTRVEISMDGQGLSGNISEGPSNDMKRSEAFGYLFPDG